MRRLSRQALALPIVLILCGSTAATAGETEPPDFQQKPVEGAIDYFDVVYLPHRVAGEDWRNRWLTMNVHVPEERSGPCPCIVFVHGGGYGGGDKDGGFRGAGGIPRPLLEQAVAQGFVAVNLNYILNVAPDGIFPQVWLDYKNAIRFLRSNAVKYRIDPARIGGWGFSAGGWLSGSGAFTTADDYEPIGRTDADADWYVRRDRNQQFLLPLDDLHTPYPDQSARVSAIVADFWPKRHYRLYTADDPAVLTYVGQDATHELVTLAREVGNEGVNLVLTDAKFRGKSSLHVPPVDSPCLTLRGSGKGVLKDEAFAWLKRQLVDSPRTPAPEARPNQRVFADSVTVRLVAASPEARIRYTLDDSIPGDKWTVWTVYTRPFTVSRTTAVRAIAEHAGFRTSAVGVFAFRKGIPPPTIKGPARLPIATVGEPYSAAFEAEGAGPMLWNLGGHAVPEVKMHKESLVKPPLGLVLNPKTGVLSGVPTQTGVFTLVIQVARGYGQPADVRNYPIQVRPR